MPHTFAIISLAFLALHLCTAFAVEEPFRPEAGKFPPIEKAHAYRGELVFVDHANRRGSLRVQGAGIFYRNDPHPFAMLPYGVVRYHGAPADLRDIPIGTMLHVRAFLPPDPKSSSVPILPVNSKDIDANHYRGRGIFPAENHVLLLEDEPSHCQREGLVWRLKDVELKNFGGVITAIRGPSESADTMASEEKFTFDDATRVWRGRECLGMDEFAAESAWLAGDKKSLGGKVVQLGITWKPTPEGIFTRFHISDLWLDETSLQRAAKNQNETHKTFMRSRWIPAWVDAVEYGQFGRATVTATLFGGMDSSLYSDFKKDVPALMNAAENTLKHAGGHYGQAQLASKGSLVEVIEQKGPVPLGSSGIQIRFETDLIIEGIRPARVVRVTLGGWPATNVPREEYIGFYFNAEDRFPTPAIFPKY